MWVFSLYTMIDGYFVANYVGEIEFSAVNISMPVITSFFAIGILLSIGIQAKVGYSLGKGDIDKAKEIFTTGFISLILASILYTALVSLFLNRIISLLGTNEQTYDFVKEYLKITIPFGMFFMTTYQLEVLIKVDGSPHMSAISVLTAAISNILLDYIFIVPLRMGLFGAGLATGVAQVVSTTLLLSHFLRKKGRLGFVKRVNFSHLKRAIPLGIGDALSEISIGYTVFLFNSTLLKILGQNGIVAYTVISYISVFAQVTTTGVAHGLAPLFSYDYGKQNFKSIRNLIIGGFAFVALVCILYEAMLIYYSEPIVALFLKENSSLRPDTIAALMRYSIAYIFIGCNVLMVTMFASLGKGKIATLVSLLRTPILVTVVMLIYKEFIGGKFIWYVLPISEGLTTIVAATFLIYDLVLPLRKRFANQASN